MFPLEYSADKLHRILLLGGDGPAPAGVPDDITIWRTPRGMDNHITMIASRDLHRQIRSLLDSQEEVELVIGSV